jgi:flagellar protein FlgJ
MVPARWRKYLSWLGSIDDHARFLLSNPRYHAAFAGKVDPSTFARAVAAAGYATDPDYSAKIIAIMRSHNLESLDA